MAILFGSINPTGSFIDKGLYSSAGIAVPPTGTHAVVTPAFSGEVAGGSTTATGIVTAPPSNLVRLLDQNADELIHAIYGTKVYGRVTWSGGIWQIAYFYLDNTGAEQTIANIATDTVLGSGLTDIHMAGVPKSFSPLDPT